MRFGVRSGFALSVSGCCSVRPSAASLRCFVSASIHGVLTRIGIHVGWNDALWRVEWNSCASRAGWLGCAFLALSRGRHREDVTADLLPRPNMIE
jgi:hypothetical protein